LLRGVAQLGDELTAHAELAWSHTVNNFVGAPYSTTETGSTWFAQDGTRLVYPGFILPVGHPDNPYPYRVALRYRFADLPQFREVTGDSGRVVLGLQGQHAGWDWDGAVAYSQAERSDLRSGRPVLGALVAAQADLSYRPFGKNDPAVLARISPVLDSTGRSSSSSVDLKASREMFAMAGGQAALALGAEHRRERFDVAPDARIVRGEIVGQGANAANGARHVTSVFAELSLPVLKVLEVQLAARHDRFSDFGSSTTPKLGLKWTALDTLALRATYAEGFRAPALPQISNSNTQSFGTARDPVRCGQTGADPEDCTGRNISSLVKANPNLKPETSRNMGFGLLFSPTKDVMASLDYYVIERHNEIDRFSRQYVVDNEAIFPGTVIRDPNPATWLPGKPNTGPIQNTIRQFFNLGTTRTSGLDLELTSRWSLGAWGRLKASADANYLLSYKAGFLKNDPLTDYAGGDGPMGATPKLRAKLGLDWSRGDWSVGADVRHVGGWFYGTPGQACADTTFAQRYAADCRVRAWTTLDLGFSYSGIRNLRLSVKLRNLEDKAAPVDPGNSDTGFNPDLHNPYGRNIQVGLNYQFR
jgi:iron complex outermembrane receptor protein